MQCRNLETVKLKHDILFLSLTILSQKLERVLLRSKVLGSAMQKMISLNVKRLISVCVKQDKKFESLIALKILYPMKLL